jgi:CPA2 family monovalent cation:H+ antiporter-2
VAVAVSALTTLSTPWLIRAADPAASWVDRKLPRPLQTVAALYGSWLERVRASPRRASIAAEARRLARILVLDAALVAAIVIGASLGAERGAQAAATGLGLDRAAGRWLVVGAAAVGAVPLFAGILRNGRRMGEVLAGAALPERREGQADLAAAPRRALVRTLQLAAVVLVCLPILAVTLPFLPDGMGAAALAVPILVLGVAAWRGATDLQGHVRAGAQVIVEALARQAQGPGRQRGDGLAQLREVLPGLGDPVAFRLPERGGAVGRSLADLDLRGRTGATVLALWRAEGGVTVPSAREVLRAGDVLALAGTAEAVEAAKAALGGQGPGPDSR